MFKQATILKIILIVITALVMFPVISNDWTNWDDSVYVINNSSIRDVGIGNLLELFDPGNRVFDTYTPLTLVTFALEYHFVGTEPTLYHIVNLIIHLINTFLIFVICKKLFGSDYVSFIVALIFGIHPTHVESVAWITERKDVLFALFYLISVLLYIKNLDSRSKGLTNASEKIRNANLYWLPIVSFLLSMFAKPQAMTLPITLLLIDWWSGRRVSVKLLLEKIPYFLIALGFGIVSLIYQHDYPFSVSFIERFALSYKALIIYFQKFLVPLNLSAFYPFLSYELSRLSVLFYISNIALFIYGIWSVRKLKEQKYLLFGLLFFLIHIFPILHFVKVNSSIIYERFTYLSYIGLSIPLAYFIENFLTNSQNKKAIILILAGIAFIMSLTTHNRSKIWKNSETLWSNVIEQFPEDYFAYGSRANYYYANQKFKKALADYNICLDINHTFSLGYNNRGLCNEKLHQFKEAYQDFNYASKLDPINSSYIQNRLRMAIVLDSTDIAIMDLNQLIERGIDLKGMLLLRAEIFQKKQLWKESIRDISIVLDSEPNNGKAYYQRSKSYLAMDMLPAAYQDFQKAQSLGYPVDEGYLELIKSNLETESQIH